MKIDFYISSLSGGGAEKVLTCIANTFAELGNEVTIISLEKRPQFYVPEKNVKLIKIKNTGRFSWFKDYFAVRKHIKSSRADVVVSFLSRCNILVLGASMFSRQKVIVSDRNNPLKEHSKIIFALQNLIYLRANQVIVQTEQIKEYYWKPLQQRITVIENPIDTKSLNLQIDENPHREKVIISVGRLEAQKDFKTLISAFAIVHKKHTEWKVKVFGSGEMQDELQRCVNSAGLEKSFIFCGKTTKPYLQMRCASIFVLSSFYEGFPNVLCEAMYAGDLCVASDCVSGPRELIENGKNGWLFDVGNIEQLADILEMCIEQEDKLTGVRNAAEETVKRLYLENIIEKWEGTIEDIV